MERGKTSLKNKMVMNMVLFALAFILMIGVLVSVRYYTVRMRAFTDDSYEFTRTAAELIDGDKVTGYVKSFERDDHYNYILAYLNAAQQQTLVKYFYVIIPTEDEMIYVWDAGPLDDAYSLGYREKYQDEEEKAAIMAAMSEDPPEKLLFDSDDLYGFIGTAYTPIYNSKGEPVALACADLPMPGLLKGIIVYLIMLMTIVAVATSITVTLLYKTINRGVIGPIEKLTKSAGEMVSNLERDESIDIDIKTGDEIETLANAFTKMDADLRDYIKEVAAISAEKERIGAELNVAAEIQKGMLPPGFPALPGISEFDLYATMDPAREVGGDFYDFFMVDDDHIALVMADVSGKGIPAALFMMVSKIFLKNNVQAGMSPAEALARTNEQLLENNQSEMFVTIWLAVIDIRTGRGVAANAGHEHPVLRKAGGLFEMIKYKHSPAVGMLETIKYKEHDFKIDAGDTLFVYTDGVPEATDANEVLFGEDRMLEALNAYPDAGPEDILPCVMECIERFVGDAPQFDDITMMAFRYNADNADSKK